MAEAVVAFGLQKLWELLIRESYRLKGVHEQATELQSDLRRLKSFVKDAETKKSKSERVKNCVDEIVEIVYDAEDIIESFLIKEEKCGRESGIKKHLKSVSCITFSHQEFGSQIRSIISRISKVIDNMERFGVREIIDKEEEIMGPLVEIRQSFPSVSESSIVGVERSVEELVSHLVGEDCVQVVSICGMGGIGKTTLARQVFHHEMVRRHFHGGLAWVFVSQDCRQKHVWRVILQSLRPKNEEQRIVEMTVSGLQDELFKLLETEKCLIVLDDLWSSAAWELIKPAFPHSSGSKILLTSRNEGVGLHPDLKSVIFRPRFLSHEESWEVFQKIALFERNNIEFHVDDLMEEIQQMLKHCGGLPLAVKTLGGLLATKRTSSEWRKVHNNIGSHIAGEIGESDGNGILVFNVLSLSYEDLPSHLKHCFLYLAHFPEDHEIQTETLFNYWVAEGIVMVHSEETTIVDVAEDYLEELVKRSMVLVGKRNTVTSRIESCRLHDVVREVCLFKAKEENFIQVFNAQSLVLNATKVLSPDVSTNRSRRLAVHFVDDDENEPSIFQQRQIQNPKARTLLYITRDFSPWILSSSSFRGLRSLRVLDLFGAQFRRRKLPKSIGKLIHLRYLSLKETNLSVLPSSLGNLELLVYLDLEIYETMVHIPNVLKKMKKLRYLMLPDELSNKTKLELSGLVKLETLKNFSLKHSSAKDLINMTKLKNLWICCASDNPGEEVLPLSLGASLKQLEELMLYNKRNSQTQPVKIDAGAFVSGFQRLNQLRLDIKIEKLPNELQFPSRIASISLSSCDLSEDPMPVLEKLHNLKIVSLELNAFTGRKMVCSKSGFPKLHTLEFSILDNLEEWVVEEESMPFLCRLEINDCRKLKSLPDGLKYITTLEELRVGWMQNEFKDKLIQGGDDHYKIQHVSSVVFYNCGEE
ncbi:unnamed protein product [Arabidopsis lyrata]|uniref:Predicted protein n=1 Tax=Arabidopsis lyrata subsp. lyrata TaxID=81972 RepID=D7M1I8_ARALL|nr:probable disease resistance protein At1g58602 [Arabidopsis lyrata subsp. lyrata]XP_020878920.1 probable disease resistance protein At1g58602 [Arabidopsis lyrata subsp. lyrata]EFH48276.1 predicted protein [Arabidopsis lyrata subsp. lyrata]CAH8271904.1 unnamed protein product [Arabidopsis lyrata]|eukprot:XP_002872017.1 probable disease resistance protein At1g58602 [Arabidopsis lyrata subsp. lyrata]